MDGRLSKVAKGLCRSLLRGELLDESWSREILRIAQDTGKTQDQIISDAFLEVDASMGDKALSSLSHLGDSG